MDERNGIIIIVLSNGRILGCYETAQAMSGWSGGSIQTGRMGPRREVFGCGVRYNRHNGWNHASSRFIKSHYRLRYRLGAQCHLYRHRLDNANLQEAIPLRMLPVLHLRVVLHYSEYRHKEVRHQHRQDLL